MIHSTLLVALVTAASASAQYYPPPNPGYAQQVPRYRPQYPQPLPQYQQPYQQPFQQPYQQPYQPFPQYQQPYQQPVVNPDVEFIRALYHQYLGREPEPDGMHTWLQRLAQFRGDRSKIVREFQTSARVERAGQVRFPYRGY